MKKVLIDLGFFSNVVGAMVVGTGGPKNDGNGYTDEWSCCVDIEAETAPCLSLLKHIIIR